MCGKHHSRALSPQQPRLRQVRRVPRRKAGLSRRPKGARPTSNPQLERLRPAKVSRRCAQNLPDLLPQSSLAVGYPGGRSRLPAEARRRKPQSTPPRSRLRPAPLQRQLMLRRRWARANFPTVRQHEPRLPTRQLVRRLQPPPHRQLRRDLLLPLSRGPCPPPRRQGDERWPPQRLQHQQQQQDPHCAQEEQQQAGGRRWQQRHQRQRRSRHAMPRLARDRLRRAVTSHLHSYRARQHRLPLLRRRSIFTSPPQRAVNGAPRFLGA